MTKCDVLGAMNKLIKHLKKVRRTLYLPRIPSPDDEPQWTVTRVEEPCLHAKAELSVDERYQGSLIIKAHVTNIGGGELVIEAMEIDGQQICGYLDHCPSFPFSLDTSETKCLIISVTSAELPTRLRLVSNSHIQHFDNLEILKPQPTSSPIFGPTHTVLDEIQGIRLLFEGEKQTSSFFLCIGDDQPSILRMKQEPSFHVILVSGQEQFYYYPGNEKKQVLAARTEDGALARQSSFCHVVNLVNFSQKITLSVQSSSSWLEAPNQLNVPANSQFGLNLLVKPSNLSPGRNFCRLILSPVKADFTEWSHSLSVWIYLTSVNDLRLNYNWHDAEPYYEKVITESHSGTLPLKIEAATTHLHDAYLFEDTVFHYPHTENRQNVYLTGSFNKWAKGQIKLNKMGGDHRTTLSVGDGLIQYRFEVDGEMKIDPVRPFEVFFNKHGIYSQKVLSRNERVLVVENTSNRSFLLEANSYVPWLTTPHPLKELHPGEELRIPILLRPEQLDVGLNLGYLIISEMHNPESFLRVPITIFGLVNGVVPLVEETHVSLDFLTKSSQSLGLTIVGSGMLTGELRPKAIARLEEGSLCVTNEEDHLKKSVNLTLASGNRAIQETSQGIPAFLITDCYLANRRKIPIFFSCQSQWRCDPPALLFPEVFLFDRPQKQYLQVIGHPSPGNVEVAIEGHSDILEYRERDGDRFLFRVKPKMAKSGKISRGKISFLEKSTSTGFSAPYAINIIDSKVEAKVVRDEEENATTLHVCNNGLVALKIFSISLEQKNFLTLPNFRRGRILYPNEKLSLRFKPKRGLMIGSNPIKDVLTVALSSSQFHGGRFKAELEANAHP